MQSLRVAVYRRDFCRVFMQAWGFLFWRGIRERGTKGVGFLGCFVITRGEKVRWLATKIMNEGILIVIDVYTGSGRD